MRQLLRILLAAVGILAIVAVAAVVYVTTFLDPEDFKPRLTAVVEEQTGLNLELDGPINWSFYPRIGVSVETANAWLPSQDEEDTAFAAIDRAEVSVAFAPLLRGEIAVDGLTLDGMRLNLKRNADGEGNWEPLVDRLMEQGGDAETVLAPASAGPNADAGSLEVVLSIASVDIKGADIRFRDEQAEMRANYARPDFGFGHAKQALFEKMNAHFEPFREKYDALLADTDTLEDVLERGAQRVRPVVGEVMERVRSATGLGRG